MKRLFASFAVCALLAGCSGVPLRSIPKLLQLNSQLLEANPAEVIVALQVEARLVAPPGAVHLLIIKLTPRRLYRLAAACPPSAMLTEAHPIR